MKSQRPFLLMTAAIFLLSLSQARANVTLSATYNSTTGKVHLSWNDYDHDANSWDVVRDRIIIVANSPGPSSYDDSPVVPGNTYTYQIVEHTDFGDYYSNFVSVYVPLPSPPTAPSNLQATYNSVTGQVQLTWTDNSNNETGFRVDRSTDGGISFTIINTVGADVTAYNDSSVVSNTTYIYEIEAYNAGGSSYSNQQTVFVPPPPPPPPTAPTGLTATAVASSQINLSWTDNSNNETGFKIERSPDNVTFSQIATVGADITSYSDTGLSASTTYFYRVRAYNAVGNSIYSNTASATTSVAPSLPPSSPSGLTATASSSSQINLSWTDNSNNESGFYIERSRDSVTFSQITVTVADVVTYSDTGLSSSTTYYYRVRAYNSAGNSGYTNTANATTLANGGGSGGGGGGGGIVFQPGSSGSSGGNSGGNQYSGPFHSGGACGAVGIDALALIGLAYWLRRKFCKKKRCEEHQRK